MAKAGGSDSFSPFSRIRKVFFHKVYDMLLCASVSETFEQQKDSSSELVIGRMPIQILSPAEKIWTETLNEKQAAARCT